MSPADLQLDRKRGMFLGMAIGDALGAAVEFKRRGTFEPVTGFRAGGPHGLNAGEWTDDNSMALALADSIAETGWDLDDQARCYLAWWQKGKYSITGDCFDIGITTRQALRQFELTGNARTAGPTDEFSSGNGSIMRLAPVPIAFGHHFQENLGQLIKLAIESSLPTHGSAMCQSACAVFAVILSGLVSGEPKEAVTDPGWALWDQLAGHHQVHNQIAKVIRGSYLEKSRDQIKGSGFVVESLEAALWAFATTNSFEEAVLCAVNLGDDADTTGAICGQIAGACWGESGIPAKYLTNLAGRDMLESILGRIIG
ncbi:MAG: ADP-ribosylglycohydrolase family protein [bacterium]